MRFFHPPKAFLPWIPGKGVPGLGRVASKANMYIHYYHLNFSIKV